MTATSAGGSRCLPAKGLDISLAALQRQDPYINNIVDVASQVALYTYNNRANEWEKTQVEGTLFIYTRLASPRHGFTIMNRLSIENLTEPITKDLDFQLQDPFLLYRNARLVIHGIWFYDKEDCQRIAQRMKVLTQQEQALAQSQGGWLSPGGGGGGAGGKVEGKPVDIIQMLTKAHTAYDKEKSTSEPKEIGGSSVLYGNPNLIKPIPVKPNTQDGDGSEPKSLSLATLFGSQHPHTPKSADPVSPSAPSGMPLSAGKASRPPVARTLTYDTSLGSKGGMASLPGGPDPGVRAVMGGHVVRQDGGGGGGVPGVLQIPTAAQQNQQNQQQQHCPAIQKLMQGQRGGVGVVLQTVSESPENRLCDNGVPLEHHHHHHHLYHHHPQHHHHLQHQQLHPDPIKRLFQGQPPPAPPHAGPPHAGPPHAGPPCCSIPPLLQQTPLLPAQPIMADPAQCAHLPPPHSQQLFFSQSKPPPQAELNSQLASTAPGAGVPPQMLGVVSPHELLQKLQLVQQEQSLASHDPPRPGLAPRFLGPAQCQGGGQAAAAAAAATAAQKAALQFQVISPQRIPATVAPNTLLSPSVFTQVKPGSGDGGPAAPTAPPPSSRGLTRSQFQAALLHLIQSDGSFLDVVYDAYVSQLAKDSSSKY